MPDEQVPLTAEPQQGNPAAQGQQVTLSINMADLEMTYANFFRVTGTFEEIILDFGLHSGLMTQGGPEPIKVGQRMVLSFATAKRLLAALQMSIGRHEQLFGVIETDPQKKMRQPAR
jgi:hypothetical protein